MMRQLHEGFWLTIVAGTCMIVLWACSTGCHFKKRVKTREQRREPVCVLRPHSSDNAAHDNFQLVVDMYPEALVLGVSDFAAAAEYCLGGRRILVIPDVRGFPVQWWDMLEQYLQQGGMAVFMGCHPFKDRIREVDGRKSMESEMQAAVMSDALHVEHFSAVQLWRHMNESGIPRGSVHVARDEHLPWDGVVVNLDAFRERDFMLITNTLQQQMPVDANAIAFYARGDAQTTRLVVQVHDQQGRKWSSVVAVNDQWRPFILNADDFECICGQQQTAGLDLHSWAAFEFGLNTSVAPQAPGKHLYGISDVRLMHDHLDFGRQAWPDIPPLSPPCAHYSSSCGSEIVSMDGRSRYPCNNSLYQSPFPSAGGWAGTNAAPCRIINLYRINDSTGICRGWPVCLYFQRPDRERPARLWGWIGMDVNERNRNAVQAMVSECVSKLHARYILFDAGCPKFVYGPNEALNVTASWLSGNATGQILRAVAELRDLSGRALRRVVSDGIRVEAPAYFHGPVPLQLGMAPDVQNEGKKYYLAIMLEDAVLRGHLLDEVSQPLHILPNRMEQQQQKIAVHGARFSVLRRPVFLLGKRYQPAIQHLACEDIFSAEWLEPGWYNPAAIEAELEQLEAMGINALSIRYNAVSQAPQLRAFMKRAWDHRMWIYLSIDGLSPLDFDIAEAERLLQAARLKNTAVVFGFELNGVHDNVGCMLPPDAAWVAWLKEQYGSFSHAEKVIGEPLWVKKGRIISPPPELWAEEVYHPGLLVYRRFVADYLSRRFGYIRRFLRYEGYPQLLSALCNYNRACLDRPCRADIISEVLPGFIHLDFLGLDASELVGPKNKIYEAAFLAAYTRGFSDNKPIVWMNYGIPVMRNPMIADLHNQARVCEHMLDLSLRTLASGCFKALSGAGDKGFMHMDGRWRPSGEIIRRNARRLINDTRQPALWKGREIHFEFDDRGLSSLWQRWREVYRDEVKAGRMEELRPFGFGRNTTDMELRTVSGAPYESPAPLAYVNAEWGNVRINKDVHLRVPGEPLCIKSGDQLNIEIWNTGITTWSASEDEMDRTVWVRAQHPEIDPQYIEVPVLPYGEAARIFWTPSVTGEWVLRPYVKGVGSFGESLQVMVEQ